jgi:hypothetical protein
MHEDHRAVRDTKKVPGFFDRFAAALDDDHQLRSMMRVLPAAVNTTEWPVVEVAARRTAWRAVLRALWYATRGGLSPQHDRTGQAAHAPPLRRASLGLPPPP